jgi:hypothetical protein
VYNSLPEAGERSVWRRKEGGGRRERRGRRERKEVGTSGGRIWRRVNSCRREDERLKQSPKVSEGYPNFYIKI